MRFERRFIVRLPRIAFLASFPFLLTGQPARRQERPVDPAQLVKALSKKCAAARNYAIEGEMRLEAPGYFSRPRMKFALAVSGSGRYALKLYRPPDAVRQPGFQSLPSVNGQPRQREGWSMEGADDRAAGFGARGAPPLPARNEYWRISDGRSLWLYDPKLREYAERAADQRNGSFESKWSLDRQPDPAVRLAAYVLDTLSGRSEADDGDPAECLLRLLAPVLGGLSDNAAQIQPAPGRKSAGPSLTVISKDDAQGNNHRVHLAFAPAGLELRALSFEWLHVAQRQVGARLTINFTRFSAGEPPPEAAFGFVPPRGARSVGRLALPGQTGSALVGGPPPDFLATDLGGDELRFSTLRGRPVLLAFPGSCQDCLTLAPLLEKIQQEYGPRGLVVLGVGLGSDGLRRMIADQRVSFRVFDDQPPHRSDSLWKENMPYVRDCIEHISPLFQTDPGRRCGSIYMLFHIRQVPSVVLVDRDWKVAGFTREIGEESLRSMLKVAGI